MDLITDDYSREVGAMVMKKATERKNIRSLNFTPDVLPEYDVSTEDILQIAPFHNDEKTIARLQSIRNQSEQRKQARTFMNSLLDEKLKVYRDKLEDPNLSTDEVDSIFTAVERIERDKLDENEKNLTFKEKGISIHLDNMRRNRQRAIDEWAFKSKKLKDSLNASVDIQNRFIRNFGSIEAGAKYYERQYDLTVVQGVRDALGARGVEVPEMHDEPDAELGGMLIEDGGSMPRGRNIGFGAEINRLDDQERRLRPNRQQPPSTDDSSLTGMSSVRRGFEEAYGIPVGAPMGAPMVAPMGAHALPQGSASGATAVKLPSGKLQLKQRQGLGHDTDDEAPVLAQPSRGREGLRSAGETKAPEGETKVKRAKRPKQ